MIVDLSQRIEGRAESVQLQLRPLLLLLFTFIFYAIGFAISWTVNTIWLVIRWSYAAAAEGWSDGKTRAAGARST